RLVRHPLVQEPHDSRRDAARRHSPDRVARLLAAAAPPPARCGPGSADGRPRHRDAARIRGRVSFVNTVERRTTMTARSDASQYAVQAPDHLLQDPGIRKIGWGTGSLFRNWRGRHIPLDYLVDNAASAWDTT